MKKSALLAVSILASGALFGQAGKPYPMPLAESTAAASYAVPQTTVVVSITVETEVLKPGPYARYAQKYLGTMAPLADAQNHEIVSVAIDYLDPYRQVRDFTNNQGEYMRQKPHTGSDSDFATASPDRTTIADRSLEDMAREAANSLYTLRKRRFDLVTGEAGEAVYGEGMRAALEEMNRMENEYLSLFYGKRYIVTKTVDYMAVPQPDKTNYVIARFTAEEGLLPETDLGGQPIVLMLTPEKTVTAPAVAKSGQKTVAYYRIPDVVTCRVMDGSRELASRKLPVYQLGVTVSGPAGASF